MINWLKKVFKDFTKDTAEDPLVMKVSEFVESSVKDISEPVWAIVECMKKYPSRFKFKEISVDIDTEARKFKVWDTKSTQELSADRWMYSKDYSDRNYRINGWKWLTIDEKNFLIDEFILLVEKKIKRLHSIQRAKMKRIYK